MSNPAELIEAKVYADADGQHVTLPPELHLPVGTVYVGRDLSSGDIVITQHPPSPRRSIEEILADIDANPFPEDFMADRNQGEYPVREPL